MGESWSEFVCDVESLLTQRNSWILVTAESGRGKTFLAKSIYEALPINTYECIILSVFEEKNSDNWLWNAIRKQWNISFDSAKSDKELVLSELEQIKREKRSICLIIDEVHKLVNENAFSDVLHLANLCDLLNINLQVVLLGDPQVSTLISKANALRNRIDIQILYQLYRLKMLKYF